MSQARDGAARTTSAWIHPDDANTPPRRGRPLTGGSARQWAGERSTAVLDHHAAGFIYRSTDDAPADEALARWATEVVPAVREAITR